MLTAEIKYFDMHGHMNFPAYDRDREEAIKRALDAGVGMITVGTDLETSKRAVELAETHEGMWATVGLHPVFCGDSHNDPQETGAEGSHIRPKQDFDYAAFKKLAEHPKVVAIGECGLDYFHCKPEDIAAQREVFIQHIKLANEVGKPLMLHVRNNAHISNAYQEAIKLLKEYSHTKANFHFFAGSLEDAKAAVEAGCSLSFTGVITFARNYDDVIKSVPLERIMSETDCPYVSPASHRGKRNEPGYVIEVVKKIAEIRGEPVDNTRDNLFTNTRTFFGI